MSKTSPLVSVIVPAYNEEGNIADCVDQVTQELSSAQLPFEILVVNDGSTDKTLEQANRLSGSNPLVRTVDLGGNFGKPVALKEGFRRAKGELIAFFDADLQYSPRDLVKMVHMLDDSLDFVNGNRDYNGYGASRTAFSRLYNRAVRLLFRIELKDSNCGIKVVKRETTDPETLFDYGLPLIVPLLSIRGFRSAEFPVLLRDRKSGESKYYEDGHFLGGKRNIKDITYHSIMLLSLLMHTPFEWGRKNRSPHNNSNP
jgi:glycosyltransferase involved in cell wall biosynthesis